MWGAVLGGAIGSGVIGGLGQAAAAQGSQNTQSRSFVDRVPVIKYKPTIEAGDPIRDVLQAETDEWLEDIK